MRAMRGVANPGKAASLALGFASCASSRKIHAAHGADLFSASLILLCHKRRHRFTELQCGQCPRAIARATPSWKRSVVIECDTWRWARWAAPRDVIVGNGRHLAFDEVFFTADIAASLESLCHQETVGRNAQSGVVVKAPPAPSLIVTQS